jgi:hypothetical protein
MEVDCIVYKILVTAVDRGSPQLRMTTVNNTISEPIGAIAGSRKISRRDLTIFGKSFVLITGEVTLNVICWVVCGILFHDRGSTLGLGLLSWVSILSMSLGLVAISLTSSTQTTGLRHGMAICLLNAQ